MRLDDHLLNMHTSTSQHSIFENLDGFLTCVELGIVALVADGLGEYAGSVVLGGVAEVHAIGGLCAGCAVAEARAVDGYD